MFDVILCTNKPANLSCQHMAGPGAYCKEGISVKSEKIREISDSSSGC